MEIETLTPRLVSTVASVAVATKGRATLDAVTILQIGGADNNGTVVLCGNRWGDCQGLPLDDEPGEPF